MQDVRRQPGGVVYVNLAFRMGEREEENGGQSFEVKKGHGARVRRDDDEKRDTEGQTIDCLREN